MDKKEKALLEGCVPNITFNEETVFPEEMSDTFPAKEYLEAGKKPGLGVEALHEQGITGKGVSIAVIDQVLYTDIRNMRPSWLFMKKCMSHRIRRVPCMLPRLLLCLWETAAVWLRMPSCTSGDWIMC